MHRETSHTGSARTAEHGYTLIELQIAILLIAILGGVVAGSMRGMLRTARGDSAMARVASALRFGRDSAISRRRPVDVQFTEPNRIQLLAPDEDGELQVFSETIFEGGSEFLRVPTMPDTPDGYGGGSAIDFDDADVVRFTVDGMLTDDTGVPINGTVFVQVPGDVMTARAITVTGGSARTQPYRWNGRAWEAR